MDVTDTRFSMGTSVSVDRGGLPIYPLESFTNAACCNQAPSRSLADAQARVVAGIHGQKETVWSLLMVFLCKRLERSWQLESWTQMGTARKSGGILLSTGGLQFAPLLLIGNSQHNLKILHLEHYTVNDFQPLHVIKGHSMNLFTEFPYLLHMCCGLVLPCLQWCHETTPTGRRPNQVVTVIHKTLPYHSILYQMWNIIYTYRVSAGSEQALGTDFMSKKGKRKRLVNAVVDKHQYILWLLYCYTSANVSCGHICEASLQRYSVTPGCMWGRVSSNSMSAWTHFHEWQST